MTFASAPSPTAPSHTAPHPASAASASQPAAPPDQFLQAVSLQEYEQLADARASFVDFLLVHPAAAA